MFLQNILYIQYLHIVCIACTVYLVCILELQEPETTPQKILRREKLNFFTTILLQYFIFIEMFEMIARYQADFFLKGVIIK